MKITTMKYFVTSLVVLILSGCSKENISETANDDNFNIEEVTEEMGTDDCVPILPIEIDTSYLWFGLEERPFKGRQEYGKAQMVEKSTAHFWEGSARAKRYSEEIRIRLESVKSEEIYYSFIDALTFSIHVDSQPCTSYTEEKTDPLTVDKTFAGFRHGDGDVTFSRYTVIEDESTRFEIVELDTINQRVSGNFNLKLLNERPHPSPFIPDTLHFVNGSFSCEILE